MIRAAVVVLAGGSGTRVGAGVNKVLLPLGGIPLLAHSVRTALDVEGVHRLVVVVRPEDRDDIAAALQPHLGSHDVWLVDGGEQRHDSEWAALTALASDVEAGEIDVIAIHDGARPLAPAELFRAVIDRAAQVGGALPVAPAGRLIGRDGAAVGRELVAVETPQAFRAGPLLAAYQAADADGFVGTDTASCLERYDELPIAAVPSERPNLKVTFAEDLAIAQRLLDRA